MHFNKEVLNNMYDENKYTRLYHQMILSMVSISPILLIIFTIQISNVILGLPLKDYNNEIIIKVTVETLIVLLIYVSIMVVLSIYLARKYLLLNAIEDIRHYRLDVLTNICRRRVLEDRILLYEKEPGIGIIYLDIDNFKTINDLYGHKKGDEILVSLAEELVNLRNYFDFDCYRLGGDEFLIVVKTMDNNLFQGIISEIDFKLTQIQIIDDKYLSVSIGSSFSKDNICISDMMQEADKDMYNQKKHKKK